MSDCEKLSKWIKNVVGIFFYIVICRLDIDKEEWGIM